MLTRRNELFLKLEKEVTEAKNTSDVNQFKKQIIRTQLLCELILEEINEHTMIKNETNDLKRKNIAPSQPASVNKKMNNHQDEITDSIFDF